MVAQSPDIESPLMLLGTKDISTDLGCSRAKDLDIAPGNSLGRWYHVILWQYKPLRYICRPAQHDFRHPPGPRWWPRPQAFERSDINTDSGCGRAMDQEIGTSSSPGLFNTMAPGDSNWPLKSALLWWHYSSWNTNIVTGYDLYPGHCGLCWQYMCVTFGGNMGHQTSTQT